MPDKRSIAVHTQAIRPALGAQVGAVEALEASKVLQYRRLLQEATVSDFRDIYSTVRIINAEFYGSGEWPQRLKKAFLPPFVKDDG